MESVTPENMAIAPAAAAVTIELTPRSFREEIAPIGTSWVERAKAYIITDQASYDRVVELLLAIDELERKIVDKRKESKDLANRTHLRICQEEREDLEPVQKAKRIFAGLVAEWDRKQKALRSSEASRKRAEIKSGGSQAPAAIPGKAPIMPMVLPPVPRIYNPSPMISTRRIKYKAEVFDIRLLCRAVGEGRISPMYVEGTAAKLNDLANSEGPKMNVPGVRAVPDTNPNIRINRRG
jgi:hypothetical protein